eukprot:CAMPEP_0204627022 /NCGR_PEP_ID=MMETSP0717-20131115/12876_1 /ASSEMBLY_ACC=CAM_ASM_000666 /TAXON_ID=230516 /ORGANISM="Chaetoceros curvisetus" /LENGTH=213 /DNA_ID=CAMNT_0051643133 /DNA_START=533 /DNA_END=1174 /DNA_ORIENTATION=+
MGLLYHHAFVMNQTIEKESEVRSSLRSSNNTGGDERVRTSLRSSGNNRECQGGANASSPLSSPTGAAEEEGQVTPQDRVQNLSRLYRREITIQATAYVAAFCFTYIPTVVAMACAMFWFYSPVLDAVSIFTYPMGGFLNILVYTRPKIASLRRTHPEYSRFKCFWLVLRAGGEIPSDDDLAVSCCEAYFCNPNWMLSDISQSNPTQRMTARGS